MFVFSDMILCCFTWNICIFSLEKCPENHARERLFAQNLPKISQNLGGEITAYILMFSRIGIFGRKEGGGIIGGGEMTSTRV